MTSDDGAAKNNSKSEDLGNHPLPSKKPKGKDLSDQLPRYERPTKTNIGKPYDPRPGEDKARRRIAYALVGVLVV
uniref:Uncharacterized protein n=1 Tax=Candidatus Kentrum sp. TC TaxID=2126339 RepID=A0A450YCB1_9GAMM|nr:MAG: hypothetical protein BECKTC1821E_GA0114239_100432 [Candidatus Kentron sp. TC]VFK40240.1 MAG: hypothetical protein BECKTC1821D_GA0114238_100916 [Candidatus Kentron sp. TC]VFK54936.1 MAG: hypothetical protein BECKTC1821F_GA0114240_100624 [Candidatus Kentron sp. TC]